MRAWGGLIEAAPTSCPILRNHALIFGRLSKWFDPAAAKPDGMSKGSSNPLGRIFILER